MSDSSYKNVIDGFLVFYLDVEEVCLIGVFDYKEKTEREQYVLNDETPIWEYYDVKPVKIYLSSNGSVTK